MLLSLHEFRCPLGQKKGGPQEMQVYPDISLKISQLIIDILAYPDIFMKRRGMYGQSGYVIEKQSDVSVWALAHTETREYAGKKLTRGTA